MRETTEAPRNTHRILDDYRNFLLAYHRIGGHAEEQRTELVAARQAIDSRIGELELASRRLKVLNEAEITGRIVIGHGEKGRWIFCWRTSLDAQNKAGCWFASLFEAADWLISQEEAR